MACVCVCAAEVKYSLVKCEIADALYVELFVACGWGKNKTQKKKIPIACLKKHSVVFVLAINPFRLITRYIFVLCTVCCTDAEEESTPRRSMKRKGTIANVYNAIHLFIRRRPRRRLDVSSNKIFILGLNVPRIYVQQKIDTLNDYNTWKWLLHCGLDAEPTSPFSYEVCMYINVNDVGKEKV